MCPKYGRLVSEWLKTCDCPYTGSHQYPDTSGIKRHITPGEHGTFSSWFCVRDIRVSRFLGAVDMPSDFIRLKIIGLFICISWTFLALWGMSNIINQKQSLVPWTELGECLLLNSNPGWAKKKTSDQN